MISFNLKKASNPKSAVDRHFNLLEKIKATKNEDKLIELCKEDVDLFSDFKREYIQKATEEAEKMHLSFLKKREYISLPKSYPSFKKLSILYEKRHEYNLAIDVCQKAIKAGYSDDGTAGGMKGRIEKLKAKMG